MDEHDRSGPEMSGSDGLPAGIESLTTDEKEAFLARVRSQGRTLTPEESARVFGQPNARPEQFRQQHVVDEMEAARLDAGQIASLQKEFFPEVGDLAAQATPRLVLGVIFDFDYTLATLSRPLEELMIAGARDADAYMRSTGMELPEELSPQIVEARRFSEEKSEEEGEEHLADDALSFLLQFFGYPASKMDMDVLRRAVDIFYAYEMSAWRLRPGAKEMLKTLHSQGYKLAVLANHNCDRVFQRTIDYLGIRPYLDLCLSSATVETRKPSTKFFQLALDRWAELPYEVVVVGDSLKHDIAGGIELGALTGHVAIDTLPQVAHDNQQIAAQVQPDAVIDSLEKLPEIVRMWT